MRPENGCIIQIYIWLELKARNIHGHYLEGVNEIYTIQRDAPELYAIWDLTLSGPA